ncbi:uncharacterized protein LOC118439224 [Folsomia candida]|uniref:uncharacterized protein LOC118439224 n=1 Tax=Folsomia candida TaxID=158441 RepID=UPI001604ECCA|nr:uncharacterized protein LOC118439224 [Folsomia candida]
MPWSSRQMRAKTYLQATPRFPPFLEKYGNYLKAVELQRFLVRGDDSLMMNEVTTILQKCANLLEFAFLPYKATFWEDQQVGIFPHPFSASDAVDADFTCERLLGEFATSQGHHVSVANLSSPTSRSGHCILAKSAKSDLPRPQSRNADGCGSFGKLGRLPRCGGGHESDYNLGSSLQDWDLIPNVEMENLRTVKLFVRGISNVPTVSEDHLHHVYPQVTTGQIYLRLPRQNLRENVAINRFFNPRPPSFFITTTNFQWSEPGVMNR